MGMGLLADIYSGGGHGIFLLAYAFSFGGIYASALFMDLEHPKGQIIIVTLSAFLRRIGLVPGFVAFSLGQQFSEGFVFGGLVTAALTGLLAPFAFYLLDRIFLRFTGEEREENLVRHDT
jgi:cell shape-determining protein MreD